MHEVSVEHRSRRLKLSFTCRRKCLPYGFYDTVNNIRASPQERPTSACIDTQAGAEGTVAIRSPQENFDPPSRSRVGFFK